MAYRPPYPPSPPAPKPAPWKVIGGLTAGILVLCCGGFTAIGYFADDTDGNRAASFSETAPTGATGETATATGKPARSTSPGTVRSKPAPARTTTAPRTRKPSPTRTTSTPKPTTKSPKSVYYKNCDAVRAAGAAPIRRGDPGYARHLDRDGDGQGCGDD
ncbi:hypothetical protein Ait01nite_026630 [Actinoplanes italicus]|uniref:Excalibur calcium-binding domain-containing protein n=1 Tax=Actinoplanes italicus TaxID=113567 RepID=A0A2T0KF03_9ACTN|nr:excalibur calcium-binding domain-containing protein [Actinoplanes italicus]PRX21964.1 excalibur calcium-binding domain-containing protein [Actinoplanes italicus]GIE29618.1 hypothetical protein Ait01nite_026630 [Actinoplanes italicus]